MSRTPQLLDLFISYAPADEAFVVELEKCLALLKRRGITRTWHRGRVGPGEERDTIVVDQINSAHVILLIVSRDFLACDDCYELETRRALERHNTGYTRVIPIIVRACDWRESPFGTLQPLPTNGNPLANWSDADEFWQHITQELRTMLAQPACPPQISPGISKSQTTGFATLAYPSNQQESRETRFLAAHPEDTHSAIQNNTRHQQQIYHLIATNLPGILAKNTSEPAAVLIRAGVRADAPTKKSTLDQWTYICAQFSKMGTPGLVNTLRVIDQVQIEFFSEELSRWAATFIDLLIAQFGSGDGGDDMDAGRVRMRLKLFAANEASRWQEVESKLGPASPAISTQARQHVSAFAGGWRNVLAYITDEKTWAQLAVHNTMVSSNNTNDAVSEPTQISQNAARRR